MAESILKWVDEEACKEAIKAVRRDGDPEWAVISYAGTSGPAGQQLKLLGTGGGGVDGLKAVLADDIVGYCLLRTTDQIDNSITTKFVYIGWVGSKVGYMQKSRVSVHVGPVKQFIGQFHVDLNANTQDEITQEIIMSKVMDFSGSGSRVIDSSTGRATLDAQAKNTNYRASVNFGSKRVGVANDQVAFVNEDEAKAHIKEVRTDGNDTDWALFTYEDPKTNNVVFLGKGSGGVAEMSQHLKDDAVCYGLVRKVDQIDMTAHSKFCFVNFVGDNINRMLRARLGTHQGAVRAFFAPFHVDISCSQASEISDDIVLKLIKSTSGTESKVLSDDRTIRTVPVTATKKVSDGATSAASAPSVDAPAAAAPKPTPAAAPKRTVAPRTPSVSSGADNKDALLFDNEDSVRGGLKSVRDDSSGINWCIITYDAPRSKTLTLAGTGSGGVSEFIDNLADDKVCYGLVRLIETVDNSQTVKFCFVNWTGQNIHRMQRATLSTHKGFVTQLFSPFHVDLECEKKDEVSEAIIYAKIKKAAGTANYVLN